MGGLSHDKRIARAGIEHQQDIETDWIQSQDGCQVYQIGNNRLKVYVGSELICEHEILTGNERICREKEHFRGLLSEVLKENKARLNQLPSVLKFSDAVVETRSLSVYDRLSEGWRNEQLRL